MHKILFSLVAFLLFGTIASAEWQQLISSGVNPNYVVISIDAVDENIVWAVLDTNCTDIPQPDFIPQFMRTTDGGTTWKTGMVTGVENMPIFDITAIDSNTAWIGANDMEGNGAIYKTTDGGTTWTLQKAVKSSYLHFFDADNGVMITKGTLGPLVHLTIDGGRFWNELRYTAVPRYVGGEFHVM
ncbi:hypothetical protein JXJ21_00625 [candidate division KSB1 bacterium]|nr:hypothetical protein [candidate division KSB1 bacterium]